MLRRFRGRTKRTVTRQLWRVFGPLLAVLVAIGALTALFVLMGGPAFLHGIAIGAIPATGVAFAVVLAVVVLLGVGLLIYSRYAADGGQRWRALPAWGSALLVSTPAAALVTAAVGLEGALDGHVVAGEVLLAALTTWLLVTVLSWRSRQFGTGVRWARSIATGAGGGIVACGLLLLVDRLAVSLPDGAGLAAFLVAWPVVTAVTCPSATGSGSALRRAAVRSGIARRQRSDPGTVATAAGFLGALCLGWGTELVGGPAWLAALTYLLTWPLLGTVVFSSLRAARPEREGKGLVVVAVDGGVNGIDGELVVENVTDERVDLDGATILDTARERHRLSTGVRLDGGQRRTLALPDGFSLEPGDAAFDLPMGYTLTQAATTPVVYTRDGSAYRLHRTDGDTPT